MASRILPERRFSPEEWIGLAVAFAAHVGLFAWLALDPLGRAVQPPPERMTVSLTNEVALESASPDPSAQAPPDVAPERGEAAPEPVPMVVPAPQPAPRAAASPLPRPSAAPPVRPGAKPAAKAAPVDDRTRRRPDAPKGASRVGDDFLKGLPGARAGAAQSPPAARAGPQVAASLSQAIARQLKPRWVAPQGAEADQLVTVLAWDLNRDGSLAGMPRLVSQAGVTDANKAQQARHAEQAIRAVQLAAPFDLPAQYYDSWKRVASFRFDRKLSQ